MSGGPFWYRFKAISCADPGEFQREMTRLSQDGWSLVECGLEEYKHWAHLRMEDRFKRVAQSDQRHGSSLTDRRKYPADPAYGAGDTDKPEKRSHPTSNRRKTTRRMDRATGADDQARIAAHEKMIGKLALGARGPNT